MPECQKCGDCCRMIQEHNHACVLTEKEARYTIYKEHCVWDKIQWVIPYDYKKGSCPLLDGNRCSVHIYKPISCTKFFCNKKEVNNKIPEVFANEKVEVEKNKKGIEKGGKGEKEKKEEKRQKTRNKHFKKK